MSNGEISELFNLLSKLTDLHGEDAFKAKSYSIAAYNIDQLQTELSTMSDEAIRNSKGIGASTAAKIREILDSGKMGALEEMLAKTPQGVLDMMQIKGLGPKKLRTIWKEMQIESVGELEYACNENRLAAVKGFGQKTQESVLQNIVFLRSAQGFQLWASAAPLIKGWLDKLRQSFPQYRFVSVGAFERQMEVIAEIEILSDLPPDTLARLWANAPGLKIESAEEGRCMLLQLPDQLPFRFYFVPADEFYRHYFQKTVGESFLAAFAAKYTLPEKPQAEADIFKANGLAWIAPPMREDAAVLEKAATGQLPDLIQAADIKGLIHAHSRWSDGQETIATMVEHALQKGWEYMLLTDHSQAAFYANGLNPARVAEQHAEIEAVNKQYPNFKVFKGIESDILNDGSLDYEASVLATFDLVIASVHSNLKMSQDKAMQRILSAIQNPYTSILGHPTGRLLLSREGYPLDHQLIIDACADHQVCIEINAHPRRLDLDWRWIDYALEKGVLLSINPDAHALSGYDDVHYGCMVAQKGGLSAARNLSSFSREQLEKFIESQKIKRNLRSL